MGSCFPITGFLSRLRGTPRAAAAEDVSQVAAGHGLDLRDIQAAPAVGLPCRSGGPLASVRRFLSGAVAAVATRFRRGPGKAQPQPLSRDAVSPVQPQRRHVQDVKTLRHLIETKEDLRDGLDLTGMVLDTPQDALFALKVSGGDLRGVNVRNIKTLTALKKANADLGEVSLAGLVVATVEDAHEVHNAIYHVRGVTVSTAEGLHGLLDTGSNLLGVNLDLRADQLTPAVLRNVHILDPRTMRILHHAGADLRYVDIKSMCMRSKEEIQWIKEYTGGNLRGIVLNKNGMDLQGIDLSGADLTGANLFRARLQGADFTNAILRDANLNFSELEAARFHGAVFSSGLFVTRNLRNVDLRGARAEELHISGPMDSDGMRLSLGGPDDIARHFILQGHDLSRVSWEVPPDLPAAARDSLRSVTTTLQGLAEHADRPADDLDRWFHHWDNGISLLTRIDDISAEYRDLKVALMQELCRGLAALPERHLASIAGPVLEVLDRDPGYQQAHPHLVGRLRDSVLPGWNVRVQTNYLQQMPQLLRSAVLHAIGKLDEDYSGEFAAAHGMAIYQMLYALETYADTSTAQNRKLARRLREAYESRLPPKLRAMLAEARLRDDEDYRAVLSEDRNVCVFLHHEYFANRVLSAPTGKEYRWFEILTCRKSEGADGYEWGMKVEEEVFKPFPVLHAAYERGSVTERLARVVEALELGSYRELFVQALNETHSTSKLVDQETHGQLVEAFDKLHEIAHLADGAEGVVLTAACLNRVREIYGLQGESDQKVAHVLLWLAALFARYSSSRTFGQELDSPQGVRSHAAALINTAARLCPELIEPAVRQDWLDRLQGRNGAFTCTAVLYDMMASRLRQLDTTIGRDLYSQVIPLLWR